jgi:hypothetical protein
MNKIKSNHKSLLNYFVCNHNNLSKNYLRDCESFLNSLNNNNNINKKRKWDK